MKIGILWLLLTWGAIYSSQPAPTIHVFGDSHSTCCFGSGLIPEGTTSNHAIAYDQKTTLNLAVHHLGPRTMHRIGRDGLAILNFKKHNIQNDDVVVLTFGEIDVRCHIGKQHDETKRDLDEILNTLVNNYMRTINLNRAQYANVSCVIMETMPPSKDGFNPNYPFWGTLADRANITKKLNARLLEACCEHNILYLPMHDLYANSDGTLNMTLSDGCVHVNPEHNHPLRMRLLSPIAQWTTTLLATGKSNQNLLRPLIYLFRVLAAS